MTLTTRCAPPFGRAAPAAPRKSRQNTPRGTSAREARARTAREPHPPAVPLRKAPAARARALRTAQN